jgi:hypothetical protein
MSRKRSIDVGDWVKHRGRRYAALMLGEVVDVTRANKRDVFLIRRWGYVTRREIIEVRRQCRCGALDPEQTEGE